MRVGMVASSGSLEAGAEAQTLRKGWGYTCVGEFWGEISRVLVP